MSNTISIGQLRQNPTAMIRAVRDGETYVLTDRGVPVADIVPHRAHRWLTMAEAAEVLAEMGPDPVWAEELRAQRELIDDEIRDPWERGR
jgi:prevent-host-death family protein